MEKVATIASRHWKALLGFNLLVFGAAIATIMTTPRVWKANTQLIIPTTNGGNLDANLGTLGSFQSNDPSFSTQVNSLKIQQEILGSNALLEQAWNADPEKDQPTKPRGYGQLFKVSPVEQTSVMSLSVSGSSPEIAKERSVAFLNAYQQRLSELRQANNQSRDRSTQQQLDDAQRRLRQAQAELAAFQRSSGLVNSQEQTKGMVETIRALSESQAEAKAQAAASRTQAAVLASRLRLSPNQAVQALGLDQNADYQLLRKQLTETEINLAKSRSVFRDRSPNVQRLLSDRAELQRQLQRYVTEVGGTTSSDPTVTSGAEGRATIIQQLVVADSEANGKQQQSEQLQQQIDQLSTSLKMLPNNQARLLELQRQVDVAEGAYKGLAAQVEQSKIDTFNAYPNVQVLSAPTVDLKPASPRKSVVAINALLAAIVGSAALILFLEARNPLLSPKDLQSLKFPIVARVARHRELDTELSPEAEVEFQRLASAVSLQSLRTQCLLVTSATVGEGKTTITLRLAAALTDLGFRVLLVDGDFRKAELSQRLGIDRERSWSNQPVSVQHNLDFLPANPVQTRVVDLVKRGRFARDLAAAQSVNNYDYVLIDSAPISLTSETALMAAVASDVLFVVRPGISARVAVNESLEQLAQHRARVIGLVINGVETPTQSYIDRLKPRFTNL